VEGQYRCAVLIQLISAMPNDDYARYTTVATKTIRDTVSPYEMLAKLQDQTSNDSLGVTRLALPRPRLEIVTSSRAHGLAWRQAMRGMSGLSAQGWSAIRLPGPEALRAVAGAPKCGPTIIFAYTL